MTPAARQLALDLPLRPALGRSDFLVSDCNAAAVAWIDQWPDWPGAGLVLHGPSGAGKSHLAAVWQAASNARAVPEQWQDVDPANPVLVEDAEARLTAGAVGEEDLLHLYNTMRAGGGTVLFTARTAPSRWPVALPDLASRLRALSAVSIGAPDDALLAALVAKLFHDRQVTIKRDVVAYLVARVERSFAAVQRTVEAIDRLALEDRKPIGLAVVRRALAEEAESHCSGDD